MSTMDSMASDWRLNCSVNAESAAVSSLLMRSPGIKNPLSELKRGGEVTKKKSDPRRRIALVCSDVVVKLVSGAALVS